MATTSSPPTSLQACAGSARWTPNREAHAHAGHGQDLEDAVWEHVRWLQLLEPGAAHAIHLWWLPRGWRFGGWYVNLQEPFRRTPLGFDYMDHMLDIVIEPDLSWRWKDEDELDGAVSVGLVTQS